MNNAIHASMSSKVGIWRGGYSRGSWCGIGRVNIGVLPKSTRALSSSTPKNEEINGDTQLTNTRTWRLLYHRSPSRSTVPRYLFGVSSFNLCYWSWYVADFTPSLNESAQQKFALNQIDEAALEMMLVDPTMGYVGLGLSSVIWLGAYIYCKQVISAIWSSSNSNSDIDHQNSGSSIAVSTLKLPFLTQPKILKRTEYDPDSNDFDGVEDISFTETEVKSASAHVFGQGMLTLSEDQRKNDVLVKFDGDFSRLRGHLAIKTDDAENKESGPLTLLYSQKYLLDIASADEIMPNASPALLNSLVLKDYHFSDDKKENKRKKKAAKYISGVNTVSQINVAKSIKNKGGFGKKKKR